jgi:hypothetical protein
MNAWNPTLFRDFRDPLYDLSIAFGCRSYARIALRDLIGFGTMRPFRRPVTHQSSGYERLYGITPIFSSRQSGSISRSSSR